MSESPSTDDAEYSRRVYEYEISHIPIPQRAPRKVDNKTIKIESPAGAGKSTSIVLAVDYHVQQGISPDSMLVVAFNVSVPADLRAEFATQLPEVVPDLTIQTLHKQAREKLDIGGAAASTVDLPIDFDIADEAKQAAIAVQACEEIDVDIGSQRLLSVVNALKSAGIRVDPVSLNELDTSRLPVDDPVIDAAELELSESLADRLDGFLEQMSDIVETEIVPGGTSREDKMAVLNGLEKLRTHTNALAESFRPSSRTEALVTRNLITLRATCEAMVSYTYDNWPEQPTDPVATAAVPAAMLDADSPTEYLNTDLESAPTSFPVGEEFRNFASEALELTNWVAAYQAYESVRAEAGLADFQDLTYYAAVAVAQNPESFQGSYDIVFVDEAQDINLLEFWLVSLLGEDRVVFIGDSAQTVNEFRGGDRDLFERGIEQGFQKIHTDCLDTNYRSRAKIVEFSDRFRGLIDGEDSRDTLAYRTENSQTNNEAETDK
ncbi:UvrD-helicase domain-containing protein [Haloprofundus salinisoli]|uniref:UvrD-helicase domain-containing protein n=1 Tax=Haloprofundus salinisoli TaxID=2876193 RepID=UPI001CC912AA|nr:UvrD-helicase domain-containing protein [Haloprofundus salinisoli]